MRKFALYFLPAISLFGVACAVVYGWIAVRVLLAGQLWMGCFLMLFAIAGLALGIALWRAWRAFMPKRASNQ
jgi:hypothetical protein